MSDVWQIWRDKSSTYCLYAAVVFMPFSVAACHGALIAFLLLWLFERDLFGKIKALSKNYQVLSLVMFGILLLFGVMYSDNKGEAWFVVEKKLFFLLLPVAIASSSVISAKLFRNLVNLFCLTCFTALIICYVDAYQRLQLFQDGKIGTDALNYLSSSDFWNADGNVKKEWMFFSYVSLSGGVNMHPTYLAMYAAFCSIALTERIFANNLKLPGQVGIFLLITFFSVSIIFLAARVVVLMLVIIYSGMMFYQLMLLKNKTKMAFIFCALLTVLIAGTLINPVTRYRQIDEIVSNGLAVSSNKNYDNSTGIRASLWWVSAQTYLGSSLLFGTGTGDVEDSVRKTADQFGITNVLHTYNPHNEYLHVLLSSGFFGLILFMFYLTAGLAKAWQNRDIIFLNFLLLFMAVCLTESALELQKGIVFFSIFFSCMSFQRRETKEAKTSLHVASVAG